jgi:hypothetical protein
MESPLTTTTTFSLLIPAWTASARPSTAKDKIDAITTWRNDFRLATPGGQATIRKGVRFEVMRGGFQSASVGSLLGFIEIVIGTKVQRDHNGDERAKIGTVRESVRS